MDKINIRDDSSSNKDQILSVSSLNEKAKRFLEMEFATVKVEGEISDLIKHRSGHWYFSLKDEESQLRGVMFRSQNNKVNFNLKEGDQVILSGKLSLYSPKGSYQFITDKMKLAGDGNLLQKFELLKEELSNRGFFEESVKKNLPIMPQQIVIITSPQGAAIRDIVTTFNRRFPSIQLIVLPVPVQGDEAANAIAEAIDKTNKFLKLRATDKDIFDTNQINFNFKPDAIIIGRGGGDLEDLWAFNELVLAESIFKSHIPIISAVGHETDTTISDLVADVRAPTPTAAAELLSPEIQHIQHRFNQYEINLKKQVKFYFNQKKILIEGLKKQIKHPDEIIKKNAQMIDFLDNNLINYIIKNILDHKNNHKQLKNLLFKSSPHSLIKEKEIKFIYLKKQLMRNFKDLITKKNQEWLALMDKLNIVSPLATLDRGYSITSTKKNGVIFKRKDLAIGESIYTQLSDGIIQSVVEKIDKSP